MPGLFGGSGPSQAMLRDLHERFGRAWGKENCEVHSRGQAALGGHAFGPSRALATTRKGRWLAVDGEANVYRNLEDEHQRLFRLEDGHLQLDGRCTGNLALLDPDAGVVHLAAHSAGAFPLYFARTDGGLIFASLLRPLARALSADVDRLGTLQFLRRGYVYGARTPFRDVRRLRPGETLCFDPRSKTLERSDRSESWVGEPATANRQESAGAAWKHLRTAVERATGHSGRLAVMMSGGWDSRTLLEAAVSNDRLRSDNLIGFSHGDTGSRELRLVRTLCTEVGLECRLREIRPSVLDPDRVRRDFRRTGTAIFPYWHVAGHALRDAGCTATASGIFGEVLGGHYGTTMTAAGLGKIPAFFIDLLGLRDRSSEGEPVEAAWTHLREERVDGHWYLEADFEASVESARERINADLRTALERLHSRGIGSQQRLIEACVTEHRGSQYIAAQGLSSRVATDVVFPFGDEKLFEMASRVPLSHKIHNALNREILERRASPLLDHPLAATLASASRPLLVQETSRALRKGWESARWAGYFLSGRRLSPPRLSWVNFEFLRDGESFMRLVDTLETDLWDRQAMHRRIERVRSGRSRERLHPLFDQLGKIYTADLLLR